MVRGSVAFAGVAFAGVLALAGCVPSAPTPVPTTVFISPTATPTVPPGPQLVEGGTAEENQAYFDKVNQDYIAVNGSGVSLNLVENLANAGFRKQDMQVTADHTSIDLQADSIVLSVRLKGQCLIGDFQASGYKSIITPLLGTGGCLIGTTVPIQ
jgi:hypothetical protein